jgi:hypothetical protein
MVSLMAGLACLLLAEGRDLAIPPGDEELWLLAFSLPPISHQNTLSMLLTYEHIETCYQ